MSKLSLRKAAEKDNKFLFTLANETQTRKNSFNQHKITSQEHEEWYSNIMCSSNQKQYIFMDDDTPIGQGRLDLRGQECCLSYSIIPERRGCGYGKMLIYLLTIAAQEEFASCKKCYGDVLKHNVASQKLFEDLGFQCEIEESYYRYYVDMSAKITPPPQSSQQQRSRL